MSRFFVDPVDINDEYIFLRDKNDLHHLKRVLRLDVGDELDISDGEQWEYKAVIEAIADVEVVLKILNKQEFYREPALKITLYQGIPKASKMEGIIQKAVELGVHSIVPVFMERTVVVDKGNFGKKLDRWQKISDEAVKQCKRGLVPVIEDSKKFKDIIGELEFYDLVIFPYENAENITIKDCLRKLSEENNIPKTVAIIIGPEGGFSNQEVENLAKLGISGVSLGKTILRTETAGPTAIAMTMYELEM